jgi:hypothetical protein
MESCSESILTKPGRDTLPPPMFAVSRIILHESGTKSWVVLCLNRSLTRRMLSSAKLARGSAERGSGRGRAIRTCPCKQSINSVWPIVNLVMARPASKRKPLESVDPLSGAEPLRGAVFPAPAPRRHTPSCHAGRLPPTRGKPVIYPDPGHGVTASLSQSLEPQYLQWMASPSCPSPPHSGQAWVLTFLPLVTPANSTETIPVGTAMMP